jgi:hypothetical protein
MEIGWMHPICFIIKIVFHHVFAEAGEIPISGSS